VVSFTPWPLYFGEGARYPFDKRLGGLQNQSGCNGEEKEIPAFAANRTPVVQACYMLYPYRTTDKIIDGGICMRVYPKVSGLASWSENCK
jgi:hypothetical protein